MFTLNDRRERELFEYYEELAEFFEFDENAHNPIMADCDLFEDVELWKMKTRAKLFWRFLKTKSSNFVTYKML